MSNKNYEVIGDYSDRVQTIRDTPSVLKGYIVEKDVPVPMRDGLNMAVNVYRPNRPGKFPVLMSFTAFSKDKYWYDHFPGFGRGYEPWSASNVLDSITFEANDPAFWCNNGYVLIIGDPRGFNRTPGTKASCEIDGPPGEQAVIAEGRWARDQYDAIEWAAAQEWSNGNVGLSGVSILGFSQWRVAADPPPSLKAFDPWEAMINFYQDCLAPGGVRETAFTIGVGGYMKIDFFDPAWPAPENEDPPAPNYMHENDFLKKIKIPALIAGNWTDAGCHTRGSFKAFKTISSEQKWLYTHGRSKWALFYSSEARTFRKMFFDHFLVGNDDRILRTPRVSLMLMDTIDKFTVRYEDDYPVPGTIEKKYYLTADGEVSDEKPAEASTIQYKWDEDHATFKIDFDKYTELIGPSALKLWVSTDESDDMDIFVTYKKYNADGEEVRFESVVTPDNYTVTIGFMRVSHRELDECSTPLEPLQKHTVGEGDKIKPGEIVPVEIPVWPAGVIFHEGEQLQIEVAGKYRSGEKLPEQEYFYEEDINKGNHIIHLGGEYDSYVILPIIEK